MDDLRFLDPEALVNRAAFNERFGMLNDLMFGLGNQYLWEKVQYSPQKTAISDLGVGRPIVTTSKSSTIYYSNEVSFSETGEVSLKDPVSQPDTWVLTNYTVLRGKYFYNKETGDSVTADKILWFSEDANFPTNLGAGQILVNSGAFLVSSTSVNIGYVNSSSHDAYPPAEPDGYTYTALGQLGNKVRIETGSYTGTGTYGQSNPNSLTFGFVPKVVFVYKNNDYFYPGDSWENGFIWVPDIAGTYVGSTSYNTYFTQTSQTLSWYTSGNANYQLNASGQQYNYIAIG